MSHFEFMIPIRKDDLLEAGDAGGYSVRHVYDLADLRNSVHDLVVALSTDRGEFVLDKFDVLYSAIVHFSSLKIADREQIWETINKGFVYLTGDLSALLESEDCLDSETRMKYLNLLKMSTYVLCQLAEAFEDAAQRPADIITTGKGRKKGARAAAEEVDWEPQRFRVLRQLYTVLQLQLRRLWDPPVPDEEFVNAIGNVCYHFLALPSVGHVRNKALRESIFQVLGSLVRSYGHSLSCSLKMIQMLQQYEHCPAPLAQGAVTIALEYQGRGLINDMVREIAGTDAEDLAKDGSATRHYAEFLSLVAVQAPDLVLNNICLLIGHLDGESHLMRNAILAILGDMISHVLNGEQLEEKQRTLRDEFLDSLEQHMHDVHAFVRSKALQIWRRLVSEGVVPLSRQRTVLKLAVGRLRDTSSNVRRAALQLVTAFLQANPFAAKLPVAELEEQYKAEKAKLAELGVELEDDGEAEEKDDDEEEEEEDEEEEDALTKAIKKAKKLLTTVLTAAVADSSEPSLLESRQQLLSLLTAEGQLDAAAAADLLLAQPALVPGLLPAAAAASSQETKESQESQDSQESEKEQESQESEKEQESQGTAAVTRDQLAGALDALVLVADSSADSDLQIQIDKQKMMVLYFKDSVVFARLIDEAVPCMCGFLRSAQTSDILEAVSFFVTAFEFGLLKAMVGIRQMLSLIWSKEKGIKEAVVDAYKRLYIPTEGNERFRAHQVVTNLSALCEDASLSELTSLEELVVQLVGSAQIGPACIQLLWERFTGAAGEQGQGSKRAALILIGMVAGAEVSVVSSNLDVLVEHGLRGGGAEEKPADFRMVQSVCTALLKMAPKKPRADDPLPPLRLSPDHQLFVLLPDILATGLSRTDDVFYTPMAQSAVDVIYQLADRPDSLMEALLRRLNAAVVGAGSAALARWLAVAGHTAVCQLTYLDVHVFTELKRRNRIREEAAGRRNSQRGSQGTPGSASGTPVQNRRRMSQDGDDEDDMMGAAANDAEAEFISNLCENHVVNGDGMLAAYIPLLVEINSESDRFRNRNLRAAAALALSKFMLVSSVVCEEHLQLLFTVLERSTDDVIRSNIIVALGDMSFRFPNLIEPWTPNIYARLRDDSVRVRRTTLTVLTHLTLNDMVKVKGQISEVAERLVDSEESLRGMAKEFFSELAHKGNALYNVMPDIVSRLSDPDVGLAEDDFHTVLQFVLGLIQKDRQLESLVEKLCHRLRAAPEPRQWRDLAFCLSLINFSDRCVKKLLENFSCFAEKLHEKDVYDCFSKIGNDAKKGAKSGEARTTCEEYESRLTEAHDKAVEDDNAATGANRAAAKKQTAGSKATRGEKADNKPPDLTPRRSALSVSRQRATRRRVTSSSEEGSSEEEQEEEEEGSPAEEKTTAAASSEDSGEEEEGEDGEENGEEGEKGEAEEEGEKEEEKPRPAGRQPRGGRSARQQQPSSRPVPQQRSTRSRR